MAKHYTYEGKQVGFVRKMVDNTILIEDAWVNEVRVHLANGYDTFAWLCCEDSICRRTSSSYEHKHGLSSKNYSKMKFPMLKNTRQMKSAKGNLFAKVKNTAASAVDTVVTPVGKTVGGGINAFQGG